MQAGVLSLAAQPADGERAEQDHVHTVEDENGKTFGSREQRERRRCREQRRIGLGLGLQNFIGEQCKLDRPIKHQGDVAPFRLLPYEDESERQEEGSVR
jgi:hypothetical protein